MIIGATAGPGDRTDEGPDDFGPELPSNQQMTKPAARAPNQTYESTFINLPVSDLERSKRFFSAIGFEFDPQFTDERAACMVVSDRAFVMLLQREFFQTFTPRPVGDPTQQVTGLYAFSCPSRSHVDQLVEKAVSTGAEALDGVDHGFMYYRAFIDLDGHHWEPLWMDRSASK